MYSQAVTYTGLPNQLSIGPGSYINNDRSKYYESFIGSSAFSSISPLHLVGTAFSFSLCWSIACLQGGPDTRVTLNHSDSLPQDSGYSQVQPLRPWSAAGLKAAHQTTPLRRRPKMLANGRQWKWRGAELGRRSWRSDLARIMKVEWGHYEICTCLVATISSIDCIVASIWSWFLRSQGLLVFPQPALLRPRLRPGWSGIGDAAMPSQEAGAMEHTGTGF